MKTQATAKQNFREILIPTKFGKFLCVFEPNDPEQGFTVESPEAPGFVTSGRSFQEAKKMAKEGLEFHCECEIFERVKAPRPSREEVMR